MQSKTRNQSAVLLAILCMVLVQLACSGSGNSDTDATVEALAVSIALTATAEASGNDNPEDELKTAVVESTDQAIDSGATQEAQSTLSAADLAATEAALAPIIADLPNYGVDPNEGEAGWIHPPFSLDLDGYMQNDSKNYFIYTIVEDFVLSADITWNTQYGTSGCGFVLRADGNEEKPNQYMVVASRAALGHVVFTTMAEGDFILNKDIFAGFEDPTFDWQNDSTNRLTIVARGRDFSIYSNGYLIAKIRSGEPPERQSLPIKPDIAKEETDPELIALYEAELAKYEDEVGQIDTAHQRQQQVYRNANTIFERGFVALLAISESGETHCSFDNAWLWLLDSSTE
jgi:hypothetical protein